MSDTPAQPTIGLVHRFVGNPQSMIGQMIKRGSAGRARVAVSSKEEEPSRAQQGSSDLDILEQVLGQVETAPEAAPPEVVIEEPAAESTPEPAVEPVAESIAKPAAEQPAEPALDQTLASQLVAASAEGVLPQAIPQVMQQTADALDPALHQPVPVGGGLHKEAPDATVGLDQVAAQVTLEAGRSPQVTEVEPPSPEIPVEVESYLQEVKDNKDLAPKEVVIADGSQDQSTTQHTVAQPVVVLPITPEAEKTGERKNGKFSVRWLVEWSRKVMKMFVGKVVYRPIPQGAA